MGGAVHETGLLRLGLRTANAIINKEPFATDLAEGLRRVVGADCVCIDVCQDWPEKSPAVTLAGEPGTLSTAEINRWMRLSADDDPYVANLAATHDPRPYRISDLMAFSRFRQTSAYREMYAGYGMRHMLLMAPRFTKRDMVIVGLTRRLHDFSDSEATALRPLRDLIATAMDYQVQVDAIQTNLGTRLSAGQPRRLSLTDRENQVLELIATGHTNDQAARTLGISSRTIRKHLEGIFSKAKVPSRAAAVAWWLRQR